MKTLVTAEMAESILRTNTRNRLPRPSLVEFLAREMIYGRFLYNGESIIISKTNVLLDGQHRLMAIVSSGIACYLNIERGIDDEVMHTIDTGSARVAADVFEMNGIPNSKRVASTTRLIMDEFGTSPIAGREGIKAAGKVKISSGEILDFYTAHSDIIDSMTDFIGHLYNTAIKLIPPSQGTAYFYLLAQGRDGDTITRSFMRELYTGLQEGKSNLAISLHKKLINDKMSLSKISTRDKINMVIYAHLNYKKERVLKVFRGSVSSAGALKFPHSKDTKETK